METIIIGVICFVILVLWKLLTGNDV